MSTTASSKTAVAALVALLLTCAAAAGDDALTPTHDLYRSLKSYADTGVVVHESGSRHTFKTYYRAPRHFYFEFNMDPKAGGWRYVLWCDGGDFQSWNSYFDHHERYARGSDTTLGAFAKLAHNTSGTITMIPALLYAGSGLNGLLNEIAQPVEVDAENVAGRRVNRLEGVARSVYPGTKRVHNIRNVKVWVDAQTKAIIQTFEDTPEGMPRTAKMRSTVTYKPQLNPHLADDTFRFSAPSTKK